MEGFRLFDRLNSRRKADDPLALRWGFKMKRLGGTLAELPGFRDNLFQT